MSTTFAALGVPEEIARRLADRGIHEPFPIQAATIPDALAGRDLCGKAPTGSGKTIAFGVPMLARVTRSAPKRPKGLVLAPTRELALQVADELRSFGTGLRVLAVYGGAGIEPQIKQLRAGVDIVVACPGRLLDVIERKACDLRDVTFAVIDEADRMADMGFLPDVRRILDQTGRDRQTLLFSATLDGAIDALVTGYQSDPVVHEMPDDDTGDVVHHFWTSERPERTQLTAEIIERVGPTIVFSRTRHGADRIAKQLEQAGVSAAPIHGARSQAQRERALTAFHRGDVKALVATDVAARGIHVEGVMCVVHFDLPADPKDYVHRSGRTGRAGNVGSVVALVPGTQRRDAAKLRKQAAIDAELCDPAVAALPEGHAAFRAASGRTHRSTHRAAAPGSPKGRPQRKRSDDRYRTDRPGPSGGDRTSPSGADRAARPSSARSERVDRPASSRSERADRPVGSSSRSSNGSSESSNRAERRRARFGEPDSAERRDRAAAKRASARRDGGGGQAAESARRAPDGGAERSRRAVGPSGTSSDASGRLDEALAGSAKVRPSGASRRKAKRASLIEAGEPLSRTKKRRTGRPRPPADSRRA